MRSHDVRKVRQLLLNTADSGPDHLLLHFFIAMQVENHIVVIGYGIEELACIKAEFILFQRGVEGDKRLVVLLRIILATRTSDIYLDLVTQPIAVIQCGEKSVLPC